MVVCITHGRPHFDFQINPDFGITLNTLHRDPRVRRAAREVRRAERRLRLTSKARRATARARRGGQGLRAPCPAPAASRILARRPWSSLDASRPAPVRAMPLNVGLFDAREVLAPASGTVVVAAAGSGDGACVAALCAATTPGHAGGGVGRDQTLIIVRAGGAACTDAATFQCGGEGSGSGLPQLAGVAFRECAGAGDPELELVFVDVGGRAFRARDAALHALLRPLGGRDWAAAAARGADELMAACEELPAVCDSHERVTCLAALRDHVAVGTAAGRVHVSAGASRAAWTHPAGLRVVSLEALQAGSRVLLLATPAKGSRVLLEVDRGTILALRLPTELAMNATSPALLRVDAQPCGGRGGALVSRLDARHCLLEVYDAHELAAAGTLRRTSARAVEKHRLPPGTRATAMVDNLLFALHGGSSDAATESTLTVAARVQVHAPAMGSLFEAWVDRKDALRRDAVGSDDAPPPPFVLQRLRLPGVRPREARALLPLPRAPSGSDGGCLSVLVWTDTQVVCIEATPVPPVEHFVSLLRAENLHAAESLGAALGLDMATLYQEEAERAAHDGRGGQAALLWLIAGEAPSECAAMLRRAGELVASQAADMCLLWHGAVCECEPGEAWGMDIPAMAMACGAAPLLELALRLRCNAAREDSGDGALEDSSASCTDAVELIRSSGGLLDARTARALVVDLFAAGQGALGVELMKACKFGPEEITTECAPGVMGVEQVVAAAEDGMMCWSEGEMDARAGAERWLRAAAVHAACAEVPMQAALVAALGRGASTAQGAARHAILATQIRVLAAARASPQAAAWRRAARASDRRDAERAARAAVASAAAAAARQQNSVGDATTDVLLVREMRIALIGWGQLDLLGDAADAAGDVPSGLLARLRALQVEAAGRRRPVAPQEKIGGGGGVSSHDVDAGAAGAPSSWLSLSAFGSAVGEEAAASGAIASVLPLAVDERVAMGDDPTRWRQALAADGDAASEAKVAASLTCAAAAVATVGSVARGADCVGVGAAHFERASLPHTDLEVALRELAGEDGRAAEAVGIAAGVCDPPSDAPRASGDAGGAPFLCLTRGGGGRERAAAKWSVRHRVGVTQEICRHRTWSGDARRGDQPRSHGVEAGA